MSAHLETPISVHCDILPELADRVITTNINETLRSTLLESLYKTRAKSTEQEGNMRWRADFLGTNGNSLHRICIDRGGTLATFDGTPAKINTPLYKWLKYNFGKTGKAE